ncbi:MAG: hypothetical protein JNM36_19825 [Chitinophagales bacterium]|jgi:hypothetical protein|nr:hypothetical protein [Chitinophagales bacterium]
MAKLTVTPQFHNLASSRYGILIGMEIAPDTNMGESVYAFSMDIEVKATVVAVQSNTVPSTANIRLVAMQPDFSNCFLQDEGNRLMVSVNSVESNYQIDTYSWNLTLLSRQTQSGNNLFRTASMGNIYCIVTIDSVGGMYQSEVELNFRMNGVTIDHDNKSHILQIGTMPALVI